MLHLTCAAGKRGNNVFRLLRLIAARGAFQMPFAGLAVHGRLVDDIVGILRIQRKAVLIASFDFFILFSAAIGTGIGFDAVCQMRRLRGHNSRIPPMIAHFGIRTVRACFAVTAVIYALIAAIFMIAAPIKLVFHKPLRIVGAGKNNGVVAVFALDQRLPFSEIARNALKHGIKRRITVYKQAKRLFMYFRTVGASPARKGFSGKKTFI